MLLAYPTPIIPASPPDNRFRHGIHLSPLVSVLVGDGGLQHLQMSEYLITLCTTIIPGNNGQRTKPLVSD